ncbi:glycoside hydrolase family 18 protein [Suillus clintonianus]|uniref:glycoside hydrolase family 18 protein n=1 Tax=Suillus clintonianus TaxID=1904413 RepID=UPI001B868A3C|nr:glycoside hydrolase family 18 protein [Suillus clintonianus]KAG2119283.1 glycoside hydrolase family 18 protein [Suillus clintonianus]
MVHLYLALMVVTTAFACFGEVASVPLEQMLRDLTPKARSVLKRATPVAPHFVLYSDAYVSTEPTPSNISGFNVFALSFLEAYGAADQAQEWAALTASQRSSILSEYQAAGISLIVSLFGSTETPTSSGYDPIGTANTMAAWVIQYGLQGVDVDYEACLHDDFAAFNGGTGSAEQWLGNFTTQLRTQLPQGQYILTHAPVAPWFSPNKWGGGGYLWIDSVVGNLIDWYNVQYYNQGTTEYTTCDGLLYTSSTTWPQSALFQIANNGVSLDKLVIGKPATSAQANNGYIDPSTLASCVSTAYAAGWNAGVMVWEYPYAAASWIATVRGNTWPMSSTTATSATPTSTSTSTTTTATPTTTSTTTTTGTSTTTPATTCTGVAAWTTGVAYTGGAEVTYSGYLWTAKWWTENDTPGGPAGVWVNDGACTSTATATAKRRALPVPIVTPAPAL